MFSVCLCCQFGLTAEVIIFLGFDPCFFHWAESSGMQALDQFFLDLLGACRQCMVIFGVELDGPKFCFWISWSLQDCLIVVTDVAVLCIEVCGMPGVAEFSNREESMFQARQEMAFGCIWQ